MEIYNPWEFPESWNIYKYFDRFKEQLLFLGEKLDDDKRYKFKGYITGEEYKEMSKREKKRFLKDYDYKGK